jgi:8-oxo-dGTP diphosphatase
MKIENIDMKRAHEISVKGLAQNDEGKILVIRDSKNRWELPGGGLEHGEDILECLKRECVEELGVECEILDERPWKIWVGYTKAETYRMIVLYKIRFKSADFKKSHEAEEIRFVDKEELKTLDLVPQLSKLREIL